MAEIKPFCGIRPNPTMAHQVAALPYDVYNREEALAEVVREPLSFLKIDRAETNFDTSVSPYDSIVYEKAKELIAEQMNAGIFITDDKPCYYIYELTMNNRSQTGLVACASIDDYLNNHIKKHEKTRADKEQDRIQHVNTTSMQTGPIFLAYRSQDTVNQIIHQVKQNHPLYNFESNDKIRHTVWIIDESTHIEGIANAFAQIDSIYIADGHHRAASAVKVGCMRRENNPDYDGTEEFNYFLSVLFPHDQLMIMDYNRVVKDLNGHSSEELLQLIEEHFTVAKAGHGPFIPEQKGSIGMYLEQTWYSLTAKEHILSTDPVKGLDVSLLQDYILSPILNVQDPRTDKRIDFVGGIRGMAELEKRANTDMTIAFSMYPTSITELFDVADADLLMPPKSTWFEPKLRSGLFLHKI